MRCCGSAGKESACNARDIEDVGLIPGSGRSPGGGNGNPLVVVLLDKCYGQRNLEGYSPLDRRVGHNLATKQQSSDNIFKSKKPTTEEYPQNTNNSYTLIRKMLVA